MGKARLWAASGDMTMFKMEVMERNLTVTDTRSLRDQVGDGGPSPDPGRAPDRTVAGSGSIINPLRM